MRKFNTALILFSILTIPFLSEGTVNTIALDETILYSSIQTDPLHSCLVKTLRSVFGGDEDLFKFIIRTPNYFFLYTDGGLKESIKYRANTNYDSLNDFERAIFNYYKFDKDKSITFMGLGTAECVCIQHKYLINGSLQSDDKYQLLEWNKYDFIGQTPTEYRKIIEDKHQKSFSNKNCKIGLLFDKKNSDDPILLGITFFKYPFEAYYIGPNLSKNLIN